MTFSAGPSAYFTEQHSDRPACQQTSKTVSVTNSTLLAALVFVLPGRSTTRPLLSHIIHRFPSSPIQTRLGRQSGNHSNPDFPANHPAHVQFPSALYTDMATKHASIFGTFKATSARTHVLLVPHPHLSGPDSVGSPSFSSFALCPTKMEPSPRPFSASLLP